MAGVHQAANSGLAPHPGHLSEEKLQFKLGVLNPFYSHPSVSLTRRTEQVGKIQPFLKRQLIGMQRDKEA